MNSAAKLHTRGIAVIGATALIATAFGPAAMAWTDAGTAESDEALAASIGLIDADDNTVGTQGIQALTAGTNDQAIADVRFVVPSTFKAGDKLTFQIGNAPTKVSERISFVGVPAVNIDPKPYGAETHIQSKSPLPTDVLALTGSVEAGKETSYTVPNTAGATPVAPQYDVALGSSGAGVNDQLVVTFKNNSEGLAADAKFIGAINGAKVNVGADVAVGAVPLKVTAENANGSSTTDPTDPLDTRRLFVDGANAHADTTYPAIINNVALSVSNGAVAADGSTQFVGPISVAAKTGAFDKSADVTVDLSSFKVDGTSPAGAEFDIAKKITITEYNASGQVVGTAATNVTPDAGKLTRTVAGAGVTRVEFSGMALKVPDDTHTVTYTLDDRGGLPTLGGIPTAAPASQIDIVSPTELSAVTVRATQPATRTAGFDRYSTATKLADQLATPVDQLFEVENIVLASGENFADALSSGYLADTKNAPVILTTSNYIPGAVKDFIRNRGVKNVYIVGGTSAVSAGIENELKDTRATDVVETDTTNNGNAELKVLEQKLNVVRIAGENRFVTNRNVNRYAYETGTTEIGRTIQAYGQASRTTGVIVNGLTPWDALAAGPLVGGPTGGNAIPVILTHGSDLEGQAKGQLGDFDIKNAIVVGGEGVVPAAAVSELNDRGVSSIRLAGADRWATGKAVNEFLLKAATAPTATSTGAPGFGLSNANSPFLVNGGVVSGKPDSTKWADALAVGPVAAAKSRVVALTDSATLPGATADFFRAYSGLGQVEAVGGTNVVSDAVVQAANALLNK